MFPLPLSSRSFASDDIVNNFTVRKTQMPGRRRIIRSPPDSPPIAPAAVPADPAPVIAISDDEAAPAQPSQSAADVHPSAPARSALLQDLSDSESDGRRASTFGNAVWVALCHCYGVRSALRTRRGGGRASASQGDRIDRKRCARDVSDECTIISWHNIHY